MTVPDGAPESSWARIEAVLDEEISHLPPGFRIPILLCLLNQRTQSEAALQLGISAGALWSRLTSACEALRERLEQRGLRISSQNLTRLLSQRARSAAVPDDVVESIMRLAKQLNGRP